jgi:hypothetical protein
MPGIPTLPYLIPRDTNLKEINDSSLYESVRLKNLLGFNYKITPTTAIS